MNENKNTHPNLSWGRDSRRAPARSHDENKVSLSLRASFANAVAVVGGLLCIVFLCMFVSGAPHNDSNAQTDVSSPAGISSEGAKKYGEAVLVGDFGYYEETPDSSYATADASASNGSISTQDPQNHAVEAGITFQDPPEPKKWTLWDYLCEVMSKLLLEDHS